MMLRQITAKTALLGLASRNPTLFLVVSRLYHPNVIDHFENPRNVGSFDMNDPNVGTGFVGAPQCGDLMKLQVKFDGSGQIIDARFKTFGCASAIASSSLELYFGGVLKFLKEQQVDVRLKTCDSDKEAAISAHKLILSARSEVFKKMFESDDKCKTSATLETTTLSELKPEELEAFVEFIYSDESKFSEKAKQNVMSLYRAADKYEIPHLRDLCRNELLASLNSSNALEVLELAQIPFDKALSDAVFTAIRTHKSVISNSTEFKDFVVNHPDLTIEIMKSTMASGQCCRYCRNYCGH